MWSDIFTLGATVLGITFILMLLILRLMVWRCEDVTVTIPLYTADTAIFSKVYNIYSVFDFIRMDKKCTVVIINYGAPDDFCNEIIKYYEKYNFLKVVNASDIAEDLF